MSKIIGIDLGTTNSCVSVVEGGEATVIVNADGMRTTPSVVDVRNGEIIVGETARRQAATNMDTVFSIKRHMGTDYKVHIKSMNKDYTPQEISAMILQNLKKTAEAYLGTPVTDAVITVDTPPNVSIPNESGVTSSNNTSLTSPVNTPP